MRNIDEIKEFVLELLNKEEEWEKDDTYYGLYHKVQQHQSLNKNEKEILVDMLGSYARMEAEKIGKMERKHHHILSEIDVLSIYSDAWGHYCIG